MFLAIFEKDTAVIKDLLPSIPLVVPIDKDLNTLVHYAMHYPFLLPLLPSNLPSPRNSLGQSPLIHLCYSNASYLSDDYDTLLSYFKNDITQSDVNMQTILHHLAYTSSVDGLGESSRYYISLIINSIKQENDRITKLIAMHSNSRTTRRSMPNSETQMILSQLHSILQQNSDFVNQRDVFGRTALHIAAIYGCIDILDMLLTIGADLKMRDNESLTPADLSQDPQTYREILKRQCEKSSLSYDEFIDLGVLIQCDLTGFEMVEKAEKISLGFREIVEEATDEVPSLTNSAVSSIACSTVITRCASPTNITTKIPAINIDAAHLIA